MERSDVARARAAYLADASYGPVIWGVSDCATSAALAIQSVTGVDHWTFFRGRYHDRASLVKLCGCSVGRLVKRIARGAGWPACDGTKGLCIGFARVREGHAVVMGFDGAWFGRGGVGAAVIDPAAVVRAWRVA